MKKIHILAGWVLLIFFQNFYYIFDLSKKLIEYEVTIQTVTETVPLSAVEDDVAPISIPKFSPKRVLPTIEELVESITNSTHPEHIYPCPPNTLPFPDKPLPSLRNSASIKKIPQIVHISGKSRCVSPHIFKHLQKWKLEGHGLFFHDDRAVHRILKYAVLDNGGAGLVPDLEAVLSCVSSGATLADIWRYVFTVSHILGPFLWLFLTFSYLSCLLLALFL